MAWRTESREALRDELTNQFNRYNIVMLCDTVCLGCVYALVVEGEPPEDATDYVLINLYMLSMGSSIMLLSVSVRALGWMKLKYLSPKERQMLVPVFFVHDFWELNRPARLYLS